MSKSDIEAGPAKLPAILREAGAGSDPVISSTILMKGLREVIILHAGERYRLRITANDKLILTK